jgi:hypothetical protein
MCVYIILTVITRQTLLMLFNKHKDEGMYSIVFWFHIALLLHLITCFEKKKNSFFLLLFALEHTQFVLERKLILIRLDDN